jgi:hypothetical protein
MKVWAIIFLIASSIFFANLLFNYFDPIAWWISRFRKPAIRLCWCSSSASASVL